MPLSASQRTASPALGVHGMKACAQLKQLLFISTSAQATTVQQKELYSSIHQYVAWSYCNTGTCYNSECEGLHEEVHVRKQQAAWKAPDRARLIIAAGKLLTHAANLC